MKLLITILLLSFIGLSLPTYARGGHSSHISSYGAGAKSEHTHVSGYTKKDGTYVAPYDRSTADHTRNNNWSTKGNTNPETGKPGTQRGDER